MESKRDARCGIGFRQRSAQPARSAGNDYDAEGCTHPRIPRTSAVLKPSRSCPGSGFRKQPGGPDQGFAPAPHQQPLQTARGDEESGSPKLWTCQTFDHQFRLARQTSNRIEVARVEDQSAGDELLEDEPPPSVNPREVAGEPPAGVKR